MAKKKYTMTQFYNDAKQILTDRNFSIPEAVLSVDCKVTEPEPEKLIFKFSIFYTNDPDYNKIQLQRLSITAYEELTPELCPRMFDSRILQISGLKLETDEKYRFDSDIDLSE